ncbi:2-dehydropantoate 2-reductase [Clostridium sp. C2-6-12]|uniref:ketopantoate reductase family protein n=1 Tax=Clostridium sp. C2-6-12 TaxID=2698832 RepID=UPI00136D45EF|nr:2-dehydropantoate 2-reductase [Clostridium sp. C2-6-12]
MKIGIVGIGAVGGYISAMLCKSSENVYVIGNGERIDTIKNNGISLKSETVGNFVAFPTIVTEVPKKKIELMDIVFVCVKGHSLKEAAKVISPMVDNHTLIIPIINDEHGGTELYSYLGKGKVAEGTMYITSKFEDEGIINHTSKDTRIVIYSNKNRPIHKRYLDRVYNVLAKADIMCEVRKEAEAAA